MRGQPLRQAAALPREQSGEYMPPEARSTSGPGEITKIAFTGVKRQRVRPLSGSTHENMETMVWSPLRNGLPEPIMYRYRDRRAQRSWGRRIGDRNVRETLARHWPEDEA